ncbi:hypothetical protein MJO28_015041 [Puccinia striiformis f. sp. tritici]|uniref:Uncharacterized protein n=1 Tax=Puccinia striiformis f. sp. tritici TaxID=168172 RepID=A0ACC0DSK8_9BASI|nr:hypothetical protein MJO28_015041 [Puccinia striiformis f. sp. tritici]
MSTPPIKPQVEVEYKDHSEVKEKELKPFSKTTWARLEPILGLNGWKSIPTHQPPTLYLSDEICGKIFQHIDSIELVMSPLRDCDNEAKVVVWVNAVMLHILLLFPGNINNDSEAQLPKAASSLGAAHAGNSGSELKTKDVRGILCSGNAWEFWEFRGNGDYTRSPQFPIPTEDVDVTVNQLRSIFEVTYRMFFEGYIEALESFIKRSQCKAQHDGKPRRPSLPQWVVSLELAKHAFITAKSAKDTLTFDEAVKQLHESFKQLPEKHHRHLPGYLRHSRSV